MSIGPVAQIAVKVLGASPEAFEISDLKLKIRSELRRMDSRGIQMGSGLKRPAASIRASPNISYRGRTRNPRWGTQRTLRFERSTRSLVLFPSPSILQEVKPRPSRGIRFPRFDLGLPSCAKLGSGHPGKQTRLPFEFLGRGKIVATRDEVNG